MAIHLSIRSLKPRSGLEPYRDANPVPTSPLGEDITSAPSGSVWRYGFVSLYVDHDIIYRFR